MFKYIVNIQIEIFDFRDCIYFINKINGVNSSWDLLDKFNKSYLNGSHCTAEWHIITYSLIPGGGMLDFSFLHMNISGLNI